MNHAGYCMGTDEDRGRRSSASVTTWVVSALGRTVRVPSAVTGTTLLTVLDGAAVTDADQLDVLS
jgi:hypothetical protein